MYTKEEKRRYNREWVAKRKSKWFSDKSCVVCGTTENLELDHINPSTKVSHTIWSWSEIRRNEELSKCQVLCDKHHMEKSINERKHKTTHGTSMMYKEYRCRCSICKTWKSNEMKQYHLNRKLRNTLTSN